MWRTLAVIAAILVIVGPALLILWLRDKISRWVRRESPEERHVREEAWHQRMLHPEVEAVEELCGGKLPERLIAMYANQDLIFESNIEICLPGKDPKRNSWWIGDFVPLTVEDQNWTADLTEFGKGCCFAGDGMGNFYWVPVDRERKADAIVYFACHDPWGNEEVADSLDEFLSRVRLTKRQR